MPKKPYNPDQLVIDRARSIFDRETAMHGLELSHRILLLAYEKAKAAWEYRQNNHSKSNGEPKNGR